MQRELLEFQKELRELNTYSSEMKRMERDLAEAEALTKAATKAADSISSKHREYLLETKKELSSYLQESSTSSKQLITDFVQKFTEQIRGEVERIEPLVNSLEDGTKEHLQEYSSVLKGLQTIVADLDTGLNKHVEELQARNLQVAEALKESLLKEHTEHTDSVTNLLQEKTTLLINAGEALQLQSKNQGEELKKVLGELKNASTFLSEVSEKVSKTDFSAQLRKIEEQLSQANDTAKNIEVLIATTSTSITEALTQGDEKVLVSLQNHFKSTAEAIGEAQKLSSRNFDNIFHQFKQVEQNFTANSEAIEKNNAAISKVEREVKQRLDKIGEEHKAQIELVNKQLVLIKQLIIAGASAAGVIGVAILGKLLI